MHDLNFYVLTNYVIDENGKLNMQIQCSQLLIAGFNGGHPSSDPQ